MVGGLFGLNPVVAQQGASAGRSMATTVAADGELTVAITASGYGASGQVVETLPTGFSYKESSVPDSGVTVNDQDQTVGFTLLGETSFTYTVTAPNAAGPYTFSGILKSFDKTESVIAGDSMVTVEAAPVTTDPTASRSMSGSVVVGSDLVVMITAADYGASGQVVETLPTGFMYKESSLADTAVMASGQTVSFNLGGEGSFTYTVTAPSAAGPHTFEGKLTDADGQEHDITGVSMVTVAAAPVTTGPRANRSMPGSVAAGGDLTVTITAADYGPSGQVVETLPTGFSYKESSVPESGVTVDDQAVGFTLLGETSFTYTVTTAPSAAGPYTFSGILRNFDKDEYDITGVSMVTVEAGLVTTGPRANRSMSGSVAAGGDLVVTITAADYGASGQVVETLPIGFSYKESSVPESGVTVDDQAVGFTLLGETSFTYTVTTAPSAAGPYTFSGILRNFDKEEYVITGVSMVEVGMAAPTPVTPRPSGRPSGGTTPTITGNRSPEFEATVKTERSIAENSPAGMIVVSSLSASDRDGDIPVFGLSGADSDSFAIDRKTAGSQWARRQTWTTRPSRPTSSRLRLRTHPRPVTASPSPSASPTRRRRER